MFPLSFPPATLPMNSPCAFRPLSSSWLLFPEEQLHICVTRTQGTRDQVVPSPNRHVYHTSPTPKTQRPKEGGRETVRARGSGKR